ncbi:MAG TPA: DUF3343 domain-containing protein [Syntrophomonadaceae bacterium]|nr:DUF3343 domain-containing protein [Syntrophomonadaceae bacterium]
MVNKRAEDLVITFTVFTFPSSHHALRAEKICKEAGFPALLVPLPREISSDCGVSLVLSIEMRHKCDDLLKRVGIPVEGIYPLTREGRQARMWQRYLTGACSSI